MFERYGVFKDQELLYSFEAEFPTDNAIMQFFVDESGRRLQYRTLLRKKGADGPE